MIKFNEIYCAAVELNRELFIKKQVLKLVSFVTSRKRFIIEGEVSITLKYLPYELEDIKEVIQEIKVGVNLQDYCNYNSFGLSDVIVDEECEDSSNSCNGGDYWKNHREIIIYEDDFIKIFVECNYRTSYDDSCCEFCGRYGSSYCCEEPTIFAIRK